MTPHRTQWAYILTRFGLVQVGKGAEPYLDGIDYDVRALAQALR